MLNRFKPPVIFYITDCSKAVLLIWFSVFACFRVLFCTVFTFCVSRWYLVSFRSLSGTRHGNGGKSMKNLRHLKEKSSF